MKNIHLLPTEKPSRLWINNLLQGKLELSKEILIGSNTSQNIYITSDEEIKDEDYCVHTNQSSIIKICEGEGKLMKGHLYLKKIILTTDQDLIADGVQAIDDSFLEWFVKNPSCEFVETKVVDFEVDMGLGDECIEHSSYYKIILPQEEPKQETLKAAMYILQNSTYGAMGKVCDEEPKQQTLEEEFSKKLKSKQLEFSSNLNPLDMFNLGAEWQAKRMYSEEEVMDIIDSFIDNLEDYTPTFNSRQEWFEQFKKK